jgi:hypothetical protein
MILATFTDTHPPTREGGGQMKVKRFIDGTTIIKLTVVGKTILIIIRRK